MPHRKKNQASGSADQSTDKDALHGGTDPIVGEQSKLSNVGGPSGGTNSVSPVGEVNRRDSDVFGGGPRTAENETRRVSPAVAKQFARDGADVDTTNGLPAAPGNPVQQDETDPTGQTKSTHASVTRGSTARGSRRSKKQ